MTTLKKKVATKPTKEEALTELDELILALHDKRDQVKTLNGEIKDEQEEILLRMEKLKIDSRTIKRGDKTFSAKRVQNVSQIINEVRLKKRLGIALWNKVSTRQLDKNKLAAFIKSGEVKASVVAECSEDKESAPYVKVT